MEEQGPVACVLSPGSHRKMLLIAYSPEQEVACAQWQDNIVCFCATKTGDTWVEKFHMHVRKTQHFDVNCSSGAAAEWGKKEKKEE